MKGSVKMNEKTKICSKCGLEKPVSEYHKNGFDRQGRQKYRGYCKTCANKREMERYWEKREYVDAQRTQCAKCGDTRTYLLDFHHKNPNEKEFTIGTMKRGAKETIQKEIDKCICLCANCHREFHHFEREQNITLEEYLRKD